MAIGYSAEIYKTYGTTAGVGTAGAKLGTPLDFPDGRRFRLALNGAVALTAGMVAQSVVPSANHVNIAVQAAADVNTFVVSVTLGATAVVANEYTDGYLYVNDAGADTTTEGYLYRIKSHPAAAASGTLAVTLYEDSPLHIALTTNSEVTLIHNRYRAVIVMPTTPTAEVIGVAPTAVPANAYFWVQTRGPAAVITSGTLVQARSAMAGGASGAVTPWILTEATPNTELQKAIGLVISVNATTEKSLIQLLLE